MFTFAVLHHDMIRSSSAAIILISAATIGGLVGVLTNPAQHGQFAAVGQSTAVAAGIGRARLPQAGDHWAGCNDARATGTAPIYRGEPGYAETMDGDGDGIACEPVRD